MPHLEVGVLSTPPRRLKTVWHTPRRWKGGMAAGMGVFRFTLVWHSFIPLFETTMLALPIIYLIAEQSNLPLRQTGDQRGPAFVMNICEPHRSSKANHFLVPMPSIKSLLPEDINYLSTKGAFTLPRRHVREALIQCYFHYVHPFSPLLDANEFLLDYEKGRMSLLLLWSMFIAAASVSICSNSNLSS